MADVKIIVHVIGTFMSLFSCLFVVVTYKMFKPLRKHPSAIFFHMSFWHVVFATLFLIEHFGQNHIECDRAGPLSEFALIVQEFYLVMFSIDLYKSLNNPFAGDGSRMKMYHIFAYVLAGTAATVLWRSKESGRSLFGFCWVDEGDSNEDYNVWTFSLFFIPMILIYFTSFTALVWGHFRLKAGLPDTFNARKKVLEDLKTYILGFTGYWTTVTAIFFINNQVDKKLGVLISAAISLKGVMHLYIWWRINQNWPTIKKAWQEGRMDDMLKVEDSINWALRREILFYTTKGICRSVQLADTQDEVLDFDAEANQRRELMLNESGDQPVYFVDYCPNIFKRLRRHYGIKFEDYIKSMSTTTKERFTEGKSGAFLYFTGDQKYIVKTCSSTELQYLRRIASQYADHVLRERNSLINKFFGAHAITMYNQTVYFIVVGSVFETNVKIHDRFDLKGSWYGRMESSKEYRDEGKGVGKDLNFRKNSLLLGKKTSDKLANQLRKDADFLASIQALDYSLLVGIHNQSFKVKRKPPNRRGRHRCSHSDGHVPFHQADDGGMTVEVVEGPAVYFLGIIDILKEWNFRSRCEYWAKVYILCQSKRGISVQNPDYYSWRFQKKIADEIVQRSGAAEKVHDIVTPVGQTRRESISLGGAQQGLLNMANMVAQAQANAGVAPGAPGGLGGIPEGGEIRAAGAAPGGVFENASSSSGGGGGGGGNGIFPSDAHLDGQPRMRKGPSSNDAGDIEMGGFKPVPAESPSSPANGGTPAKAKLARRGSEEARGVPSISGTGGLFNRSAAPPRSSPQVLAPKTVSSRMGTAVGSGPLSAEAQSNMFGAPPADSNGEEGTLSTKKKVVTDL
jgi:1-phosphatidylinositol-4-phosphate 5-kinase